MEENKERTMFQSINQANVLNARASAKKPNIDMNHLNDVISSPSPFRFLGVPDPNVVVADVKETTRQPETGKSEKKPNGGDSGEGERTFFGSRKTV